MVSTMCVLDRDLNKTDIVKRKRQLSPALSEQQAITQKKRLEVMAKNIFSMNVLVMMKDDTYLTQDGNDWYGTGTFTSPIKDVNDDVKYIPHPPSSRSGSFSGL